MVDKIDIDQNKNDVHLGGGCPFIFQVPTNILTSLSGNTCSNSAAPSKEWEASLPYK